MRNVSHLDARTYAHLLHGDLPPAEARALGRHLEEDCPECEEFLASLPGADALDGAVDRALAALAPADATGQGNDVEFARIERRMAELEAPRRRPRHVAPAALAAAVLAAGVVGLLLPRAGSDRSAWDGVKGTEPRPIPVRLRFVVITSEPGGPPVLERGVSGQPVGPAASLQFEIETGIPADVALVRVPARGSPEVFWHERVGRGRASVAVQGRPAAYPLADLSGPQRFVLVASEHRLDEGRIARAAVPLAPPARVSPDIPTLDGLSLDVVEVDVR